MRIFAIALALSSVAIPTTVSAQQQPVCATRADVADAIKSGKVRLKAQALDARGNLLQFLIKENMSWSAWVTTPGSDVACAAIVGPAWIDEPPPPTLTLQRPPVGDRGTTNVPPVIVPIAGGIDS